MKNAQNSLDLDLFAKQTLLLVTCIQVAPWYNFIGCNFPYLVDTSLGVRPFGQTYDKRSISIETLQNILNLVPPRRTSKIKKNKKKRKEKKNCFVVPAVPVVPGCEYLLAGSEYLVPDAEYLVPAVEYLPACDFICAGTITSTVLVQLCTQLQWLVAVVPR